jgi:hypothetical protein
MSSKISIINSISWAIWILFTLFMIFLIWRCPICGDAPPPIYIFIFGAIWAIGTAVFVIVISIINAILYRIKKDNK